MRLLCFTPKSVVYFHKSMDQRSWVYRVFKQGYLVSIDSLIKMWSVQSQIQCRYWRKALQIFFRATLMESAWHWLSNISVFAFISYTHCASAHVAIAQFLSTVYSWIYQHKYCFAPAGGGVIQTMRRQAAQKHLRVRIHTVCSYCMLVFFKCDGSFYCGVLFFFHRRHKAYTCNPRAFQWCRQNDLCRQHRDPNRKWAHWLLQVGCVYKTTEE